MKSNVQDFTIGKPGKVILAFFLPMLMTNMLQQVYNFVDTLIVGKGLGDDAVAAVGNMGSLFFLIVGFSLGLSNGFGIIIAQSFGAKDYGSLRKNLASTIVLTAIITIFLTELSIIFLPLALEIIRTDSIIMNDCLKYGYFVFGGLVTTILYNIASCILRSLGDSKTPFLSIVISSVINVFLDWFCIFILHTGVEGAAIATVVSQLISAVICIWKLRTIDFIRLHKTDYILDGRRYALLLKNGLPMAFMNSITAIGCMVVQAFVNGYGVAFTGAYAVCSRYINLFMNPAWTAGTAMSAYTGQNYGAKKYTRIRKGLHVCLLISFVTYILFGSVMVFAGRFLANLILNEQDYISLALVYFPIAGSFLIMVDFLFVYRSAVQAMGRPFIPMLSGFAEMILRIATIVLFIDRIGFRATAFAEAAAWTGALLINLITYYIIFSRLKKKAG